ncbi:MAG TPA: hypothetical protein VFS51_00640 [Gemmatimonadales bacterium]|nr:hypothetical protein [Gemmatimonadales bacterium]
MNDQTPDATTEPDATLVPEVRVRSSRRRRNEVPPAPAPTTPRARSWLIYTGLAIVVGVLTLDGFLSHRPRAELPNRSQATEVRSAVSQLADSLQVVVSWDLTLSDSAGRPDSIRVKVMSDEQRTDSLVSMQAATQLADTLNLPAPAIGQTVSGLSCAAAYHPPELSQETCTPWQYVRPAATAQATGAVLTRIVIQPTGLQVDPDVEGACARWQQNHPADSVWIEVNRIAVPECTGPNRKPTVAQFCAFALLPDGRRVKTANSVNIPYCEELFVEWIRERFS